MIETEIGASAPAGVAGIGRLPLRFARRCVNSVALAVTLLRARHAPDPGDNAAGRDFLSWLAETQGGRILELGTRRTSTGVPTTRRNWAHPSAEYVTSDFMPGLDVDVVADAEKLTETFGAEVFDAVIACSVFEHVRRPWLASAEISAVLRSGGKAFIQTHFAFPIHAYPHDYWRFSRQALESLFSPETGFSNCVTYYEFPSAVVSRQDYLTAYGHSFLNVYAVATKA